MIYDADERLVICNAKYREYYHITEDVALPGALYEDIIRATLCADPQHFAPLLGGQDRESWIAQRMAAIRTTSRSGSRQPQGSRGQPPDTHRCADGAGARDRASDHRLGHGP